jgi:hypothetical protein
MNILNEQQQPPLKQKRGRKPNKPNTQPILNSTQEQSTSHTLNGCVNISETTISKNSDETEIQLVAKSSSIYDIIYEKHTDDIEYINDKVELDDIAEINDKEKEQDTITIKKRGRKPKGGKIIQQPINLNNNIENKPNIILHLKCFLSDLNQTNFNLSSQSIESFNFNSSKNELNYEVLNSELSTNDKIYEDNHETSSNDKEHNYKSTQNCNKEIWKKLKNLEHCLHINNINDKKSACFWCTCDFDNPPIYIPKYYIKNSYYVYGCYCSPECAVAYLMEENIDSSVKFERLYLINHIYSKIYNYDKSIKPAPNPYYMLDKFYGNLTIQEYRSLLKNDRLFLVVDKPLTKVFPELHEDNDDFIINNKIIPSNNTYQIKKKIQKKQTKTTILNEKFGLSN